MKKMICDNINCNNLLKSTQVRYCSRICQKRANQRKCCQTRKRKEVSRIAKPKRMLKRFQDDPEN